MLEFEDLGSRSRAADVDGDGREVVDWDSPNSVDGKQLFRSPSLDVSIMYFYVFLFFLL